MTSLSTGILIFSLAFNIFTTGGMTYYAYKILELKVSPEYTWSLKFWACMLQLLSLILSVFYVHDLTTFVSAYPPMTLLVSYGIAALRSGLLFTFVYNVYRNLILKFPVPVPPSPNQHE